MTNNDRLPPGPRLLAHLSRARTTLRAAGVLEATLALVTGAAIGLGLSLLVVGWLPFSLGLRATLWAMIGALGFGASAWVVWRRVLSLQTPWIVGAALEEAAFRRGVALGDDVRSAVDLLDDSQDDRFGRSRALCDAHIDRTCERIESSKAQSSLAAVALGAAVPTLLWTATTVFVAGLSFLLLPDALDARWARLFDDQAAQEALLERAADVMPIVTDLELVLRFPGYMLREEEIVQGSSGDVVAPRGTEVRVRGRADRAIKSASMLVGEQEIALSVEGGRHLSGTFVVDQAGSYRFRLVQDNDDVELDPVAHRITLAPDEVPVVQLEEPAEDTTVQLEDDVGLVFSATDDFGITRFSLVVRRQSSGAAPFEKDLIVLETAPRELRSSATFSIAETGARPGDRLSVYLEAWDNDTVSGPKSGRSTTRVITVFSPAEHHRKLIELEEKLLDRLVHSLGDELEAPLALSLREASAAEQRTALTRQASIHSGHAETLQLLDSILEEVRSDEMTPAEVKRALRNMRAEIGRPVADKRDLAKNALSASLADKPVLAYVWRHLTSKQRTLVEALERHALYLDDLLNTQRLEEAQRIAEEIRRSQKDLKELIEQFKKTGDDETRERILEEIARLREQMQQLMKRLSALQRDIPDEYMNHEAFDTQNMMKDVKSLDELIEEGKLDEAAKMLEQMEQQTEQMMKQLEENREEYGGEEYKELRDKLERFGQELGALEAAQEELLHRTERQLQAARQEAERRFDGKLSDKLAELRKEAQECDDELKAIDPDALYVMEQEDAAFAGARTEDLEAALEAGDLEDALDSAASAAASARAAQRAVEDRMRGRFARQNPLTREAQQRLERAREKLDGIREELEGLIPDPAQLLTPGQRAAMKKDAQTQGELEGRARKLRGMMAEIGKEMPIFGPQHDQRVDDAGRQMRRAQRSLEGESLRPARSAQQQAMQQLAELREALQQQSGSGSGSGSGLPMPLPGGGMGDQGGEGRPGGDGRGSGADKVKIPGAEEFRVPDAFRKDILDAMREGAPDEWEGEVRRYYEELVK